jgi:SlyX protein
VKKAALRAAFFTLRIPMTDPIEDLQTRIGFQELEIQSLNAKVAQQQRAIDALGRQIVEIVGLLRELRPGLPLDGQEPPPPHY